MHVCPVCVHHEPYITVMDPCDMIITLLILLYITTHNVLVHVSQVILHTEWVNCIKFV